MDLPAAAIQSKPEAAEVLAEAAPVENIDAGESVAQVAPVPVVEPLANENVPDVSAETEPNMEKSPIKRNRNSFTLASAALPAEMGPVEAHVPAALSAPNSASVENNEDEEEVEEVDSENEDTVQPLAPRTKRLEPIQIPTKSASSRSELPMSATSIGTTQTALTATTESEMLVTPTSTTSPVNGRSPSRSPPRYDPIVDSPPHKSADLGRKESKWRKSFMVLGANVS